MAFVSSVLPDLPGAAGRRARRPPATPLTRERIVDAALAIVDAGGPRRRQHAQRRRGARHRPGVALRPRLRQGRAAVAADRAPRGRARSSPSPTPSAGRSRSRRSSARCTPSCSPTATWRARASGSVPLGEGALRVTERMIEILRLGGLPEAGRSPTAVDLLPLYAAATAYEQALSSAPRRARATSRRSARTSPPCPPTASRTSPRSARAAAAPASASSSASTCSWRGWPPTAAGVRRSASRTAESGSSIAPCATSRLEAAMPRSQPSVHARRAAGRRPATAGGPARRSAP